jgi:hypothetical protein
MSVDGGQLWEALPETFKNSTRNFLQLDWEDINEFRKRLVDDFGTIGDRICPLRKEKHRYGVSEIYHTWSYGEGLRMNIHCDSCTDSPRKGQELHSAIQKLIKVGMDDTMFISESKDGKFSRTVLLSSNYVLSLYVNEYPLQSNGMQEFRVSMNLIDAMKDSDIALAVRILIPGFRRGPKNTWAVIDPQKTLAFAMGLHKRLGADSAVYSLSADIVQAISSALPKHLISSADVLSRIGRNIMPYLRNEVFRMKLKSLIDEAERVEGEPILSNPIPQICSRCMLLI